jgi:hypothetical protein
MRLASFLPAAILAALLVAGCAQTPKTPAPHTGLSDGQKIAFGGGRLAGNLAKCGEDIHLLKSIFIIWARGKATDAAEGAMLEPAYDLGFQYGQHEIETGRRSCKDADEEHERLFWQYPRYGSRRVP